MPRLDKMLKRQTAGKPIKLVSNSFKLPNTPPRRKKGALWLYVYKPR
jgi:hypothetical protein